MVSSILILFFYFQSFSQDEKDFRKLFLKPLQEKKIKSGIRKGWMKKVTPFYSYDFNNDGRIEKIAFEKRDAEDWLLILNWKGQKIFETEFDSMALTSRIYKILITKISSDVDLFLIYYYEGAVNYLNFESVARLYFLTLENKKLSTFKLTKGPIYWEEFSSKRNHYRQKRRKINLYDFDGDGYLDVQVKQRRLSHIYHYRGGGNWKTYSHSLYDN